MTDDAGVSPRRGYLRERALLAAIAQRRDDPELMGRLRASIERNRAILDRLRDSDDTAP